MVAGLGQGLNQGFRTGQGLVRNIQQDQRQRQMDQYRIQRQQRQDEFQREQFEAEQEAREQRLEIQQDQNRRAQEEFNQERQKQTLGRLHNILSQDNPDYDAADALVQSNQDVLDELVPGEGRHPVGVAPADEPGRFAVMVENEWTGTIGPQQKYGTNMDADPVETFTKEDLAKPFTDITEMPGMDQGGGENVAQTTVERPETEMSTGGLRAMAGMETQETYEPITNANGQVVAQRNTSTGEMTAVPDALQPQAQEGFEPVTDSNGNVVAQRDMQTGELHDVPETLTPGGQGGSGDMPADAQMIEYLVDNGIMQDRQQAAEWVKSSTQRPAGEVVTEIANGMMDLPIGQRPENVDDAYTQAIDVYDNHIAPMRQQTRGMQTPGGQQPQGGGQQPQGGQPQSGGGQGLIVPQQGGQQAPQGGGVTNQGGMQTGGDQASPQGGLQTGGQQSSPQSEQGGMTSDQQSAEPLEVPSEWDVGDEPDKTQAPAWANPEEAISGANPRAGGGEWVREVERAAPFFNKVARSETPARGELFEAVRAARSGVLNQEAQEIVRRAAQQYAQQVQNGGQ